MRNASNCMCWPFVDVLTTALLSRFLCQSFTVLACHFYLCQCFKTVWLKTCKRECNSYMQLFASMPRFETIHLIGCCKIIHIIEIWQGKYSSSGCRSSVPVKMQQFIWLPEAAVIYTYHFLFLEMRSEMVHQRIFWIQILSQESVKSNFLRKFSITFWIAFESLTQAPY